MKKELFLSLLLFIMCSTHATAQTYYYYYNGNMVGGNKGEGLQAFYHGIPAPSMRRSYNGRGYLGNYYQPGKRH